MAARFGPRSIASFYRSLIHEALAWQWPRAVRECQQGANLRRIIRHAYNHVPFYRAHLDRAGVAPEEIRTPADLWRIPSICKEDLRAAGTEGLDRRVDAASLMKGGTGGTTGLRLTLYSSPEELARHGGYSWSPWIAAGLRAHDRILSVGSSFARWAPPPWRTVWIDTTLSVDDRIRILERYRPTVIIGLLDSVLLLAREVSRRVLCSKLRLRRVFVFGYACTSDARRIIREGLGVDPIDCYGTRETIWVGIQCEARDGYHVPSHRLVVQVASIARPGQPAGPSEVGELVLTDLARQIMPFIRYRLEDAGRLIDDPCPCGRPGPRIVDLQGRILDLFIGKDGSAIGPETLRVYELQYDGVVEDFRLTQVSRQEVRLEYIPGPNWDMGALRRTEAEVSGALGGVKVVEERVARMSVDPEAKLRRYVRKIPLPADVWISGFRNPGLPPTPAGEYWW